MELLRLVEVSKYYRVRRGLMGYRELKAVDGVSLTINRNETVTLVGESGCGKTTLGKLSVRLLEPSNGRIYFDGIDVTHMGESELKRSGIRRRMQMVFQDPFSSLNPFMTVGEILAEPLKVWRYGRDEMEERVARAMELARLTPPEEFLDRYLDELSGGQRQKVCIARALVLDPDYLVADEPVSMIDASGRMEILSLIREVRERLGMGILYVTHDLATARYVSERIAVMYLGEIVELGPTEEVLTRPLHPYTQLLLRSVPSLDPLNRSRRRVTMAGDVPNPLEPPSGCKFHTRCPIAVERCRLVRPVLTEHYGSHLVACHRAGESLGD